MPTTQQMDQSFLHEYNSQDALLKYSSRTAGQGVNYLIEHEYGTIYDAAIEACLRRSKSPLRILEFGCGAGMNLIGLLRRLERRGIAVDRAYGTDFSESLIEKAKQEAQAALPAAMSRKISFHVARNERLSGELAQAMDEPVESLVGQFHFVFGVNTFRYCHRLGNAQDCAEDIYRLLAPGGVCVMIDMNDRFPLFRSRLKRTVESDAETYLPSLAEYAAPFERAGFELKRKQNFCWIPHSAGRVLTSVCRVLTPALNATMRTRAMRSLVVAQKPERLER